MKILKEGNNPYRNRVFTCDECDCVFEASKNEYGFFKINPFDIKVNYGYISTCPCCGSICSLIETS